MAGKRRKLSTADRAKRGAKQLQRSARKTQEAVDAQAKITTQQAIKAAQAMEAARPRFKARKKPLEIPEGGEAYIPGGMMITSPEGLICVPKMRVIIPKARETSEVVATESAVGVHLVEGKQLDTTTIEPGTHVFLDQGAVSYLPEGREMTSPKGDHYRLLKRVQGVTHTLSNRFFCANKTLAENVSTGQRRSIPAGTAIHSRNPSIPSTSYDMVPELTHGYHPSMPWSKTLTSDDRGLLDRRISEKEAVFEVLDKSKTSTPLQRPFGRLMIDDLRTSIGRKGMTKKDRESVMAELKEQGLSKEQVKVVTNWLHASAKEELNNELTIVTRREPHLVTGDRATRLHDIVDHHIGILGRMVDAWEAAPKDAEGRAIPDPKNPLTPAPRAVGYTAALGLSEQLARTTGQPNLTPEQEQDLRKAILIRGDKAFKSSELRELLEDEKAQSSKPIVAGTLKAMATMQRSPLKSEKWMKTVQQNMTPEQRLRFLWRCNGVFNDLMEEHEITASIGQLAVNKAVTNRLLVSEMGYPPASVPTGKSDADDFLKLHQIRLLTHNSQIAHPDLLDGDEQYRAAYKKISSRMKAMAEDVMKSKGDSFETYNYKGPNVKTEAQLAKVREVLDAKYNSLHGSIEKEVDYYEGLSRSERQANLFDYYGKLRRGDRSRSKFERGVAKISDAYTSMLAARFLLNNLADKSKLNPIDLFNGRERQLIVLPRFIQMTMRKGHEDLARDISRKMGQIEGTWFGDAVKKGLKVPEDAKPPRQIVTTAELLGAFSPFDVGEALSGTTEFDRALLSGAGFPTAPPESVVARVTRVAAKKAPVNAAPKKLTKAQIAEAKKAAQAIEAARPRGVKTETVPTGTPIPARIAREISEMPEAIQEKLDLTKAQPPKVVEAAVETPKPPPVATAATAPKAAPPEAAAPKAEIKAAAGKAPLPDWLKPPPASASKPAPTIIDEEALATRFLEADVPSVLFDHLMDTPTKMTALNRVLRRFGHSPESLNTLSDGDVSELVGMKGVSGLAGFVKGKLGDKSAGPPQRKPMRAKPAVVEAAAKAPAPEPAPSPEPAPEVEGRKGPKEKEGPLSKRELKKERQRRRNAQRRKGRGS